MTPIAAFAMAGCLAVGSASDQILLRDLAPAFAALDGPSLDSVIAFAPAPGIERRFDLMELRRIAVRLNLPEPQREICVVRPVAPLDPARLLDALRSQLPAARIDLLDYSRFPVPEGALEFPISGLRQGVAGALWAGSILYGGGHRAAVWARVNVSVAAPRVVAVENLSPGHPIEASALKLEVRNDFPSPETFAGTIEDVAGKVPRRPVRAGTPIRSSWLDAPKLVTRGETVQVEVREGGAVLQFEGEAQGSGAIGQTILVLNSTSNKRFPARVDGKGKVSVGRGPQ